MARALLSFLFIIFSVVGYSQPDNYWTLGSNTESAIMAGAVVGGGSGITSIFYNPAGISEIKSNKISMDASLFQFDNYKFKNAYSSNDENDFLDWQVQPRFFSFVYRPKKTPKFNFQIAVFSRTHSLVKLYYFDEEKVVEPVTNIDKTYSVQNEYEKRYSDYWFGLGSSYELTDNLVVGISLLGSGKGFLYYQNSNIDLSSNNDTMINGISSWSYFDKQDSYVVSIISKVGFHYSIPNWTFGLTFTAPSIRLWGDGYHRRQVKMTNIFDNGILMPDIDLSEQNNHIVTNFKEPLSIAAGFSHYTKSKKTRILFSVEYFAPIEKYKSIDNSRVANFYIDDYKAGSDFLTFYYASESVVNFGFGIKQAITDKLFVLGGFKTDFSSYLRDNNIDNKKYRYQTFTTDLYHFSLGIQFELLRTTFLLGTEYATGFSLNEYQFANYTYPGVYSPDHYIALQDYPKNDMKFNTSKIGLYVGVSLNF